MKILIMGGTGTMGAYLGDRLAEEQDNQIFVTSRAERANTEKITYIRGNAREMDFLCHLLEQHWDVIVDFMTYGTKEFEDRAELLLKACTKYIFISSARVYADSEQLIDEKSARLMDVSRDEAYKKTDEYALTKARQENVLFNSIGRNWVIVRPYITYSETKMQLGAFEKEEWLYRALHGRTILFSKDIAGKYTTMTYGQDVANAIAHLISCKEAEGESYHITAPKAYKWEEILENYLDAIEEVYGVRPKVMLVDNATDIAPDYKKHQIIYDRLYNRKFDCSKINQICETSKFNSPKEGFKKCIKLFSQNPMFLSINWMEEAKKDKLTGERARISEIAGTKWKAIYLYHRFLKK